MYKSTTYEFLRRPPPIIVGNKVILRPKHYQDTTNDYSWRTDTELCRLDAATPLSISFAEYQRLYIEQALYINLSLIFGIDTLDSKHIGNCSYFNIDESNWEAEFGIMIGDKDYWNKGYGSDAIYIATNYIFSQTNLKKIHLKSLEWNIKAHKCFEKCGFTCNGTLKHGEYNFITMELSRPEPDKSKVISSGN